MTDTATDIADHRARDAFFTRPHVAKETWDTALQHCAARGIDPSTVHWIEPSAGAGAFVDTKPDCVKRLTAVDIYPLADGIDTANFLTSTRQSLGVINGDPVIVIGNPPFGYKADKVLGFINHAMRTIDALFVCFIVPSVATTYFCHNQLHFPVGMASSRMLDDIEAFQLPCGKAYNMGVPPYVAVYERNAMRGETPRNKHPDFITNGIHVGTGADTRRKVPVPHRIHALKRIRKGGFAFGFKPISGKLVMPADIPTEWDALDGFGYVYLTYANHYRITDAELIRRFQSIDWKPITDRLRAQGSTRGMMSPHHMVAAYNDMFGGFDTTPQPSIFGAPDTAPQPVTFDRPETTPQPSIFDA